MFNEKTIKEYIQGVENELSAMLSVDASLKPILGDVIKSLGTASEKLCVKYINLLPVVRVSNGEVLYISYQGKDFSSLVGFTENFKLPYTKVLEMTNLGIPLPVVLGYFLNLLPEQIEADIDRGLILYTAKEQPCQCPRCKECSHQDTANSFNAKQVFVVPDCDASLANFFINAIDDDVVAEELAKLNESKLQDELFVCRDSDSKEYIYYKGRPYYDLGEFCRDYNIALNSVLNLTGSGYKLEIALRHLLSSTSNTWTGCELLGKPAKFGKLKGNSVPENRYVSSNLYSWGDYFSNAESGKAEILLVTKDDNGKECIKYLGEFYYSLKDFCDAFSIPMTDVFQLIHVGYGVETVLKHYLGLLPSEKTKKISEVLQNLNSR